MSEEKRIRKNKVRRSRGMILNTPEIDEKVARKIIDELLRDEETLQMIQIIRRLRIMLRNSFEDNEKAVEKIIDAILNNEKNLRQIQAEYDRVTSAEHDNLDIVVGFAGVLVKNKTFISEYEKINPCDEEERC